MQGVPGRGKERSWPSCCVPLVEFGSLVDRLGWFWMQELCWERNKGQNHRWSSALMPPLIIWSCSEESLFLSTCVLWGWAQTSCTGEHLWAGACPWRALAGQGKALSLPTVSSSGLWQGEPLLLRLPKPKMCVRTWVQSLERERQTNYSCTGLKMLPCSFLSYSAQPCNPYFWGVFLMWIAFCIKPREDLNCDLNCVVALALGLGLFQGSAPQCPRSEDKN